MASKYGPQTAPLGEEVLPAFPPPSIPDLSSMRGFSATDAIYNRMGILSPDQKAQSYGKLSWDLIGMVIAFSVLGLMVAAGNWFAVLFLLVVGWHGLKLVSAFLEVRSGAVHQVDGDVVTERIPDSEGPDTYYLYIGLRKLEMTADAYGTLQPGGPYRIYYLWDADRVVGGEVLPGWRALPQPDKKKMPTIFGIPLAGERWIR